MGARLRGRSASRTITRRCKRLDQAATLGPYEKRVADAKSDTNASTRRAIWTRYTGVFKTSNPTSWRCRIIPSTRRSLPMTIDLGGLSAVLEFYPGHSGTDIIVRVPQQNVVYTGDLLFSGWYPVCIDEKATISGWRDTLKKFAAFDKDTIFVPGHGQVCGQEGIASIREVFDDIAAQAEKMHQAGVPAQEAIDRYVVPDKFKNFPIYCLGLHHRPDHHETLRGVARQIGMVAVYSSHSPEATSAETRRNSGFPFDRSNRVSYSHE